MTRHQKLSWPAKIARHVVLIGAGSIMLVPFIWMVSTSLKPPSEVFSPHLQLLPTQWNAVENYQSAFSKVPLLRYLLNGAVVTFSIVLLQVMIALPCAYALARLRFFGAKPLFILILAALIIPPQVPAIPRYIMLYEAGLINSYPSLILPFAVSAFGIFLLRQSFKSVPADLIDAARLDGCSEFSILWRIMVPTALPAIVAFIVLSVVAHWNDFFWPYIVITGTELATPPLGVMFFNNMETGTDYGPLMAASVIITAPILAFFLLAQRRFVEGVTLTGIKG